MSKAKKKGPVKTIRATPKKVQGATVRARVSTKGIVTVTAKSRGGLDLRKMFPPEEA